MPNPQSSLSGLLSGLSRSLSRGLLVGLRKVNHHARLPSGELSVELEGILLGVEGTNHGATLIVLGETLAPGALVKLRVLPVRKNELVVVIHLAQGVLNLNSSNDSLTIRHDFDPSLKGM